MNAHPAVGAVEARGDIRVFGSSEKAANPSRWAARRSRYLAVACLRGLSSPDRVGLSWAAAAMSGVPPAGRANPTRAASATASARRFPPSRVEGGVEDAEAVRDCAFHQYRGT